MKNGFFENPEPKRIKKFSKNFMKTQIKDIIIAPNDKKFVRSKNSFLNPNNCIGNGFWTTMGPKNIGFTERKLNLSKSNNNHPMRNPNKNLLEKTPFFWQRI